MHHKLCFNLFMLHDNLFDNQGTEKNKNDIFCTFRHTLFYEYFLPTLLYSLSLSTGTEEPTEMAAKYLPNKKNVFLIIFEKESHIIIITALKKIYIYISVILITSSLMSYK